MSKILYVVISLVIVLVAGVLIAPNFVNWNAYKPQIAVAVRDAIGRELTIDGDIDLAIFPAPALSVQRVSLANVEGAQNRQMVALDEVRVRVDIGALLHGRIAVQSVRLIRPRIALEVTKDGRASWDIQPASATAGGSGASAPPATAPADAGPFAVSLESLKIEDAVVTYHDARSGLTERVDGVSADISADSLSGPVKAAGTVKVRGLPLTFDANVGRIDTGRPVPIRLVLGLKDADASMTFSGHLSGLGPDAAVSGTLKVAAGNAAALAKAARIDLPPSLAKPFSVEGEITASAKSVGANKLAVRFGETSLSGAIQALLDGPSPKFDVLLTASRIDLDALLASAAGAKASTAPAPNTAAPAPKAAATAKPTPPAFALPTGLTVAFDITAEAAAFRGGAIRNIAVKGELAGGVLTVSRVAALLPGSADFTLSGTLKPVGGQPQFNGDLAATAGNLRSMMEWLGVDPASLPADRLRSFSYTSKLQATPKSAQITNLAMQVDTSRITGGLIVELREKPGIGLRLVVDKLNLDAYLPKAKPAAKTAPKPATPASKESREAKPAPRAGAVTLAGFPVPPALADALDAVDANVDLQAGQLSFNGETIRNARLDLTLFDNKVTVREASVADFAGVGASASAELTGVRTSPKLGLDYVVEVRDAARLFRFLGSNPPVPVARLGKLGGNGRVDVTSEAIATKSTVRAMGGQVGVDGTVHGLTGTPSVDLSVSTTHPELATLARTLAPDYRPAAAKLGPVSLRFRLSGTPTAVRLDQISGKVGPIAVEGNVAATLGAPIKVDATLRTSEVLIDLFQPVAASGGGRSGGGASGGGQSGRAGSVGGGGRGGGHWSTDPIALPLAPGVDIDAKLEMAALTKGDIQLANPKLHARLQGGKLTVDSFTARLFDGTLSSTATVEPQGKSAAVAIDLKIDRMASRAAVKAVTKQDRVEGPLSLTAKLTTRGVSEADLVAALNGTVSVSGQLRVLLTQEERNTVGVTATGGALLSAFLGSKIRELQRLAPLTQLMMSLDQAFGRNPAELSGDVTITNGVAKTSNLKVVGAGSTATTRGTADLPRWEFASVTELVDDPKLEPAVTFEASGPIDAPARTRIGGRILKGGASAVQEKATSPLQQVLPGLLGGKSGSTSGQQQQQQQKANPQDLLKQGIESIFGKRR